MAPENHSPTPVQVHLAPTRRLSRKQPPELTESLLALAQLDTPIASYPTYPKARAKADAGDDSDASSIASSSRTVMPFTTTTTEETMVGSSFQHDFGRYTLKVDPPLDEMYPRHTPSPFAWSRQRDINSPALSQQSGPSSPRGSVSSSSSPNSAYFPHHQRTPSSPLSSHASGSPGHSRHASASASDTSPPSLTSCSTSTGTSCWSASLDERQRNSYHQALTSSTHGHAKENRKQRKERKKREAQEFSADSPPSLRDLFEAGGCEVVDEHGRRVLFRDVVNRGTTIVVFIRHWYCPLCAQYMNSIIAQVSPRALEEAGVELVVIGNGSAKMLDGYRNKSFKCPFKMYTDPSLALYRALGLTRQTGDAGPDDEAGSYLVQTALEATVQTIKRATQMPLRRPGHFTQLGGEFVFDGEGSLSVSYTNRMTTTRDHSPIERVCAAAGVRLEYIHYEPGPRPPPVHRHSVDLDQGDDESGWREERERALQLMQRRKEERRRGKGVPDRRTMEADADDSLVVVVDGEGEGDWENEDLRDLALRMDRFGRI